MTFSSLTFASADSLVYSFNFSDTTKYDTQLSADIDLKTSPGKIQLAPGDQKNLALGSRMRVIYAGTFPMTGGNEPKPDTTRMNGDYLHDRNPYSFVSFPAPNNAGSVIKINLQAIRKVNRIVLIGLGDTPNSAYNLRPQAFSYFTSLDSNRMSKVFQEFNNLDSARHTAFISEPQPVQYINFVLDKQDPLQATVISEFRIFGEGYVTDGEYISKVDSTGSQKANFANAHLTADIPSGTSVTVELRTGSTRTVDSTLWSDWSAPLTFTTSEGAAAGGKLFVAEPRKYFQYRLRLHTANLETPTVSDIKLIYQHSLVSDSTTAMISPQEIPVLSPVTLTYTITTRFSGTSLGIDTINIATPSPSNVLRVLVNGIQIPYSAFPYPNKIVVAFPATIASNSSFDIVFSTKLITGGSYPSELISKASPWNPQTVDPLSSSFGKAWDVVTTGVPSTPLVDVRIDPNPFTPNGDGRNDAAVIDFSVANLVKAKPLRITVYNLAGRKLRTVAELMSGVNPFFGDPRTGGKGFLWDGRDDSGKLVLPGVYILQVTLDSDNGGQTVTKSIVVSY